MSSSRSEQNINAVIDAIQNIDNSTATYIMVGLIAIIIGLLIWYGISTARLPTTECNNIATLYSSLNGQTRSLNSKDTNCQYNFRDYYIKTAYNCCSGGSYKNDFVAKCVLPGILKQGVRGLDFEVFSVNNQPVVATSTVNSNFVKETYNYISFADIMTVVTNYAFSSSTSPNPADPIIFHIRFKSANQEMYQNLANLFKTYDSFFLGSEYSYETNGNNFGLTPLLSMSGKIVLIVDNFNTSFMDNADLYEYVNMTSNSIFMRALHYYDVKNTPDINELQQYNKQNMTITMPDVGENPPNPSGIVCRETGAQMIAMRYQLNDVNLEENNAFFNSGGYAFVLKPEKLRYIPVTIPDPTPQNPALSYAPRKVSSDYYSFTI